MQFKHFKFSTQYNQFYLEDGNDENKGNAGSPDFWTDESSYPGVTRCMHFKEANIALESAMKSNPLLNELGIAIPKSVSGSIIGKSPKNWVWHHDIEKGVMQLVPKSQHPNIPGGIFWETMHPGRKGGFSIWEKK